MWITFLKLPKSRLWDNMDKYSDGKHSHYFWKFYDRDRDCFFW